MIMPGPGKRLFQAFGKKADAKSKIDDDEWKDRVDYRWQCGHWSKHSHPPGGVGGASHCKLQGYRESEAIFCKPFTSVEY